MFPDFNRLKVFYYIFIEQSSTLAAKRLHISQPGVSQHLQKLESELSCRLFTRVNRQLIPTAAGHRLFQIIDPFIQDLTMGLKNIQQERDIPSGHLRIGAPVEFGKTYMPGIISSFRKQFPEVTFFLKFGDPVTLFNMVSKGELDFAYMDLFPNSDRVFGDYSAYHAEPIVEEELVMACSTVFYNQQLKNDLFFETLVKKEFISYKTNVSLLPTWFKLNFKKTPQHLNIVLTVESIQAVISALCHHMGLGIVVSHLISKEIDQGILIPIKLSKEKILNKIVLFQFLDKVPTLAEKEFQAHFRRSLKPITQLALVN